MHKSWLVTTFTNFFIAATLGLLLRAAFVWDFNFDYSYLLHTHSHIATLGWVYLILYALLVDYFVPPQIKEKPIYSRLFWITQLSVIGMLLSFPFQGYGAVSITFSSIHIFASYYFARLLWHDMIIENRQIQLLVRSSLLAMVISTIGIWAMGVVIGMGMQATPWYHIVVQFYLHFQFNGWFLMAVFGLLLFVFNQWGIQFENKSFSRFLLLYWIGLTLTFAHVLGWAFKADYFNLINGVGVITQLIGFGILLKSNAQQIRRVISELPSKIKVLLYFSIASLALKVMLQTFLLIPEIATISTQLRSLMIGYIHLTMLGSVSGFIFVVLYDRFSQLFSSIFIGLFLSGFILSEALLFLHGTFIWLSLGSIPNYYFGLFLVSILLPLSVLVMLVRGVRKVS